MEFSTCYCNRCQKITKHDYDTDPKICHECGYNKSQEDSSVDFIKTQKQDLDLLK